MDRHEPTADDTNLSPSEPAPAAPTRRRSSFGRWGILIGLWLVAIVVGWWLQRPVGTSHDAVGRQMSDFRLEPLTGDRPPRQLAELPGIVLITVWGPWCPSCVTEFPGLAELSNEFPAESLHWIPVTISGDPLDEDLLELRADTQQFLARLGRPELATYSDSKQEVRRALASVLGGQMLSVPTTVLVDENRTIRGVWQGYAPADLQEIRDLMRRLSARAPAAAGTT